VSFTLPQTSLILVKSNLREGRPLGPGRVKFHRDSSMLRGTIESQSTCCATHSQPGLIKSRRHGPYVEVFWSAASVVLFT